MQQDKKGEEACRLTHFLSGAHQHTWQFQNKQKTTSNASYKHWTASDLWFFVCQRNLPGLLDNMRHWQGSIRFWGTFFGSRSVVASGLFWLHSRNKYDNISDTHTFPDTHDMNYAERERGSEWHWLLLYVIGKHRTAHLMLGHSNLNFSCPMDGYIGSSAINFPCWFERSHTGETFWLCQK